MLASDTLSRQVRRGYAAASHMQETYSVQNRGALVRAPHLEAFVKSLTRRG
jgi:hypothetical protein